MSCDEPISTKADQALNSNTERETFEQELLHFEDLSVGDQWVSPGREITGDDVENFAQLTGDHDPLHEQHAVDSPFGEPVAHGLLGLSVLAGLSSDCPRAATLALVGISDWSFEAPVFFGDVVHVMTEVESIHKHGRRTGRVTWVRQLINQKGRIVQQGRFVTLVGTKARARRLSETAGPTQRGTLPAR